jgi:hypothetical protein
MTLVKGQVFRQTERKGQGEGGARVSGRGGGGLTRKGGDRRERKRGAGQGEVGIRNVN